MLNRGRAATWVLTATVAFGCGPGSSGPAPDAGRSAPDELTAVLVDPATIELRWRDNAADEGGYVVEYVNDPQEEFIIVDAVPRNATSFRHSDLVPETRFIYRVRPFFGPVSNVVQVVTGTPAAGDEAPGPPPPTPMAGGSASIKSLAPGAAPSELMARLAGATRVELKWKDRSGDEEGYLVEGAADPNGDFKAFAFVDPDISSSTVSDLPAATRCYLRVRAFFYGAPSNAAQVTTGPPPRTSDSRDK
jgi:hypothetical protein